MDKKPYAVCEEIINGVLSESFTVRASSDTNPERFMVHGYFDNYEEAYHYIGYLRESINELLAC